MRRRLALLALLLICAAGCAPKSRVVAGHSSQLDNQIARAIGDPSTCVLLAKRTTGEIVYQYGDAFNCERELPACDAPGALNAHAALKFAQAGRLASCPTSADGSRSVGWAEGRVPSRKGGDLIYSAVMEGQRALPGHEMNARLYDAFTAAGV
jgi:hypothetical protein